ncbi:pH nine-sensitive protein 1 [Mucor velutinosus]|uniref:PH nine-sensitive protein 1 n=1 Tax=Mucor velutinosus TaxID=708070 RepID=A0AAN7D6E2_9FUNG|nr:pH nine-sensitive protein 1 [Mucor velutinosus]
MNTQLQHDLIAKYTEFKNTATKIGLEEALVQYKTVGQQDWKFEVLCELYFIQFTVKTEPIDRANKNIRSVTRLLNNEAFLKENGMLVVDIIELFDEIEGDQGNLLSWKYLLEGFIHLSTRSEIIKGLAKNNEITYKEFIDHLLHCVHRLDSRYSIQLSEMIYKAIEEYPEYAFVLRFKLAEMRILPDLITRLTVVYCRDTVEFLNGIFYTNSTWFLAQSVNSGQYFVKMKNRIMASIESNVQSEQMNTVAVSFALRALIGIVAYFGIKLKEDEVAVCIKLLGKTRSERLVKLLLCLILLSADQFLRKQNDLSKVLSQLLQSEISEMPLLILVYFQTDAIQQVEDMIRSVLSMQVPIPKLGLFEMQKLFRSLKPAAATAVV